MSRDKSLNDECDLSLNDRKNPRIYITSERPLEPQFEKYRIKINPLDMHHVMAFASLYIGDSQTMAAEAGVLGVPFVRFNDFVGRIGYLRAAKLMSEKIDVTAFLIWFIENYPQSAEQTRKADISFWDRFK